MYLFIFYLFYSVLGVLSCCVIRKEIRDIDHLEVERSGMHLNYPWKRAMFVNILSPDFTLSRLKPSFFFLLLLPLETIILREKKSSIVFIPRKFTPPKNQIFFLTNFKLWFFLLKNRSIINFMNNLINYPVHPSQNTQKKIIHKRNSSNFLNQYQKHFCSISLRIFLSFENRGANMQIPLLFAATTTRSIPSRYFQTFA